MPHRDLYAAVDLGSNSFHMLVARREHGQLRVIDRIREMVRLAGGVDAQGRLAEPVRQRALDCLARFGQRIAGIPDAHIRAVGTQTFRRLHQPRAFLVVAETALGSAIDVIGGREEARLIYLGVSQDIAGQPESGRAVRRLVIDIGGGSTEIVAGTGVEPEVAESIPFGCVGATQAAFGKGRITARRWDRALQEVSAELLGLAADFREYGWQQAAGSSGTIRAVARLAVQVRTGESAATQSVSREDVSALKTALLQAGHIEAIDLPGLSASRRPVIAGGVLVLEACMQVLDIAHLEVSDFALREGLLYDLLGRLEHTDPRDRTVRAMAARHETDAVQAERVRDFALCALDQVAQDLTLGPAHHDLLEWSCRLHETGLAISHAQHPRHGAYIVEHSDMPGFTRQEQQFMAVLLRHQRRRLPPDALRELPQRLQPAARSLLVLLRLAVIVCRPRTDAHLPDFALRARDLDHLELALPSGWLRTHPLTASDLSRERRHLRRAGIILDIATLPKDRMQEL